MCQTQLNLWQDLVFHCMSFSHYNTGLDKWFEHSVFGRAQNKRLVKALVSLLKINLENLPFEFSPTVGGVRLAAGLTSGHL